jgi:hypothetical protein
MIAKIANCQVGTGNLSAKMTIKQEIPQFLPMMGRKVRVYYRGITKLCINCYQPGHIKKNCKNSTVGWIDYVQKFKIRSEKKKKSKEDSTLRMSETRKKERKQQHKMKKKMLNGKKKAYQKT